MGNAFTFYQQVVSRGLATSALHHVAAEAYYEDFELDKSIQAYEYAIASKPNWHAAYNDFGLLYRSMGEYDKAIPLIELAIEKSEYNVFKAFCTNNLGVLYRDLAQYEDAEQKALEAINLNPKALLPHISLGHTWALTGRLSEAIQQYQIALNENPNFLADIVFLPLTIHVSLDACYKKNNNFSACNEHMKKAQALLNSKDDYSSASFYSVQGEFDIAIDILRDLLDKKIISRKQMVNDPNLEFMNDFPPFLQLLQSNT
ncbi:MAG: tetratricopeptide repeat protein [Candidatus Brocadiales bacterium]|nr:tetratricopeptide repeat protein [Candidatus Brocadiales bacterium]